MFGKTPTTGTNNQRSTMLRRLQISFVIHVLVGFTHHAHNVACFSTHQIHSRRIDRRPFHQRQKLHENAPSNDILSAISTSNVHVLTDCDDETIQEVSKFLIDAYWLSTPRLWTDTSVVIDAASGGDGGIGSQIVILRKEAADYLSTQYGERMGKRLLRTCIVVSEGTATETNDSTIAGLLCMHELVWEDGNILPDDESETLLRNAIANLSPKDRRMYKDVTAVDIATKLLPPSNKAVCVFSNLAVAPEFRRQGIGVQLCRAAEDVAREWGYGHLHLKVEAENIAAARLYQNKLGYTMECHLPADPAIRLDLKGASFVEIAAETLILSKKVQ